MTTTALRSNWTIDDISRFIRPVYFGFTSSQVVLGIAAVASFPGVSVVIAILLVALAFHVFAYVQNDVFDLSIDRTQPLRTDDPLVKGMIAPGTALTIALVQIVVAAVITFLASGSIWAYITLVVGFSFMTLYNLYGKRCPVPLVTDAIQGIAWGSLAVYGSIMAAGHVNLLTFVAASFGFGFLFLINGVHGGLRDLRNDLEHGCTTTAAYFGARINEAGIVVCNTPVRLFAFTALAIYIGPASYALFSGVFDYQGLTLWIVSGCWILLNLISIRVLFLITEPAINNRNQIIRNHGLPLLLPPIILFAPKMDPVLFVSMLCCFFIPFLVFDRRTRHFFTSTFTS